MNEKKPATSGLSGGRTCDYADDKYLVSLKVWDGSSFNEAASQTAPAFYGEPLARTVDLIHAAARVWV